jgi:molybdopterin/thiamine biosynthesis adenylyltransferase
MFEKWQKRLQKTRSNSYRREFLSRAQGIIDTDKLLKKIVALIGLGSVGSVLASYLAQTGVERFTLIDKSRLIAANTSRHAADIRLLNEYKTKAVKELILARNPEAHIETHEKDFLKLDFEEQTERLKNSDLVIATTDMTACQFAINEVSMNLKLPSLYVGCYEHAQAGEVVYVIPGVTPCLNCLVEFRGKAMRDIKLKERRIPYTNETGNELQAEPGLAIDIGYVTTVAAGFALAMLDSNPRRRSLLDPRKNLILLHSGTEPGEPYQGLFKMPFDYARGEIKRTGACEVCQKVFKEENRNGAK